MEQNRRGWGGFVNKSYYFAPKYSTNTILVCLGASGVIDLILSLCVEFHLFSPCAL